MSGDCNLETADCEEKPSCFQGTLVWKGWTYLTLPSLVRPGRVVGQDQGEAAGGIVTAQGPTCNPVWPWSVRSHITGVSYVPPRAVTGASLLFLDAIVPSTPNTYSAQRPASTTCPPEFPPSSAFSIVPLQYSAAYTSRLPPAPAYTYDTRTSLNGTSLLFACVSD